MGDDVTCEHCVWRRDANCMRFPPTKKPDQNNLNTYPKIQGYSYYYGNESIEYQQACGEFRPK